MTSENAAPIRVAIMGEGRMGSLIRSTAEAARTEEGSAAFEVVAQIGFDLSAADAAPAPTPDSVGGGAGLGRLSRPGVEKRKKYPAP